MQFVNFFVQPEIKTEKEMILINALQIAGLNLETRETIINKKTKVMTKDNMIGKVITNIAISDQTRKSIFPEFKFPKSKNEEKTNIPIIRTIGI